MNVPAAETLPLFQWIDGAGKAQPVHGPNSDPREITDYVIDSKDWPSGRSTVHSVLTRKRFSLNCEVVSYDDLPRYVYIIVYNTKLYMS